jgi:flagellar hook assembly protein FlgD
VSPNPFNPRARVRFDLPGGGGGHVTLVVYDVAGRRVKTLCDRQEKGGSLETEWDGTSDKGDPAASGVYFFRLEYRGQRRTQRVTLLK